MQVETRRQLRDAVFRRSLVYPVFIFLLTVTYSYFGTFGNMQLSLPFPTEYDLEIILLTLSVLVAICQHRHDDWVASYLVAFAAPFAGFWMLGSAGATVMGRSTPSEVFFGSVVAAALLATPVFVVGYAAARAFRRVAEA